MGGYCSVEFDDLEIDVWKSAVPDFIISLFQEDERLSFPDEEDPELLTKTIYQATREDVLLRLDVMGITSQKAEEEFEQWLTDEREMYSEWISEGNEWASKTHDALASFSLEEWMRRAPGIMRDRYGRERHNSVQDEVERRMRDRAQDESWLFFDCSDRRFNYRLLLQACPEIKVVTLDISDLIMSEYLEDDVQLCAEARAPDAIERPILEPVIIMGEGKTDIRVLQASLEALYPSVREMFSFFDHDTLSVDGGASFLLKFIKALSAARMPLRVIAIFDNDAAGRQEYERAERLAFSSNVTVMCLPDLDLARSYPTIGPQGEHDVDINGRAVGIELFMGQDNLKNASGSFLPIRWTHYYSGTETYHGEVSEKASVHEAFFKDIKSKTRPEEARTTYGELNQLWQVIFAALR